MNDIKSLAIIPKTQAEAQSLAEVLAKSTLMPEALRNKAPDVLVQILAGQELGLAPMASIRGVHIVQGKPILSADTMVALCLSSGKAKYFRCAEETATSVTYETLRDGDPTPQSFTWSDEDTKAAALNNKDNWRTHKRQMRRARCKAVLARDVYPDVLAGVYDSDSGEIVPSGPAPTPFRSEPEADDAEVVSETPKTPLVERIRATTTVDELHALSRECSKLPKGSAEYVGVKAEYDAQKARLVNGAKTEAPQTETAA